MLEIFNNLFMTIAEQMGVRLQNTAYSVNIKERLDFSCALFDADGELIANAPHMPVHLGSMGESIKTVVRRNAGRDAARRRVRAQRPVPRRHAPARRDGGHAGVRRRRRPDRCSTSASRGHHADIGGITPGLDAAVLHPIEEEGVLIDNLQLVRDGALREAETLRRCCAARRYPSRNPEQNLADLRAQIAANEKGVAGAAAGWSSHFGLDVVQAYMRHVQDNAEEAVRRVIGALRDGECTLRAGQRRA